MICTQHGTAYGQSLNLKCYRPCCVIVTALFEHLGCTLYWYEFQSVCLLPEAYSVREHFWYQFTCGFKKLCIIISL